MTIVPKAETLSVPPVSAIPREALRSGTKSNIQARCAWSAKAVEDQDRLTRSRTPETENRMASPRTSHHPEGQRRAALIDRM